MLSERTSKILEAAVREFIRFGEPVSSDRLYVRYDFGIKPAMIRLELEALEDQGFLEQPHHSAGRCPSDLGYEFFAKNLLSNDNAIPTEEIFENFLRPRGLHDFLSVFSERLNLLCAGVEHPSGEAVKCGLDNLINTLNWSAADEIRSVVKDFEALDERILNIGKILENDMSPSVFIGKHSPVTKSPALSVVAGSYDFGDSKITVLAIGPKRMDYEKTIKTFRGLKNPKPKSASGKSGKKNSRRK